MDDELLDLVDINDSVTGTILRSEYDRLVREKLGYIRAVEMVIQNDKGEIWIPTRTMHKRIAPGGLDYSMGGHVSAGESYEESALREIQEELNLTLSASDLIFIKKFSPSEMPYFRVLYVYKSNDAPIYNSDDFSSAEWLAPKAVIDLIDAGVPAKTSMRETILTLIA